MMKGSTTTAMDRCAEVVNERPNDTIVSLAHADQCASSALKYAGNDEVSVDGRGSVECVEAGTVVLTKTDVSVTTTTILVAAKTSKARRRPQEVLNFGTVTRVESQLLTPEQHERKRLDDVVRESGSGRKESPNERWIKIQRRRL
ncbi:unnamed protein product [Parnassius apollo]|uniref:(apollo) hypothetical protein n=1 Tax=Parnassius apollo TaxID=110799 RepID=A0A8S3XQ57_PARAO|nr:unnamed protein product [Parnassius apollo]